MRSIILSFVTFRMRHCAPWLLNSLQTRTIHTGRVYRIATELPCLPATNYSHRWQPPEILRPKITGIHLDRLKRSLYNPIAQRYYIIECDRQRQDQIRREYTPVYLNSILASRPQIYVFVASKNRHNAQSRILVTMVYDACNSFRL